MGVITGDKPEHEDEERCGAHRDEGNKRIRCELPAGHDGKHRNGTKFWKNRGDL